MSEGGLLRRLQLALSSHGARLFRNNVGMAWVGQIVRQTPTEITLRDYRPFHGGLCTGSSDLIGWTAVTITPGMVGKSVAIFTAIEGKSPRGKLTDAQGRFLDAVHAAGGVAIVARDVEQAAADLADLIG